MPVDMFVKIRDIPGESTDVKHKEEIDILAWSWGMENPGSASSPARGGGGGAGKVNVQDLSFTKFIDKSTPDLLLHCASGKHIPEAILTVRKAGERPVEYLIIHMERVLVTSYNSEIAAADDLVTENVTLNFAAVKVKYVEQDDKGNEVDVHEFGWNIAKNAPQ